MSGTAGRDNSSPDAVFCNAPSFFASFNLRIFSFFTTGQKEGKKKLKLVFKTFENLAYSKMQHSTHKLSVSYVPPIPFDRDCKAASWPWHPQWSYALHPEF